jgi:glycosyltransferase involved in cell wall biosynthesis
MLSNKRKNKILFISSCLPYPPDDGIKIRAFYAIKELLRKGYEVKVICFTSDGDKENITNFQKEFDVPIAGIPFNNAQFTSSMGRIYLTLFTKHPFMVSYNYDYEFEKEVQQTIKRENFDLLFVYDSSMCLYGRNVNIPKILDTIDCQSYSMLGGCRAANNIIHKSYWYINYLKWIFTEKRIFPFYDAIVTTAVRDSKAFKFGNLVPITNGIDMSYFKPLNLQKIPNSMVFYGDMRCYSNQIAVMFFIENIYPLIKEKMQDIKIFIIGKNPPMEITKFNENPDINVLGYVEDIRTYIDKCAIVISPLTMATGIQNKILAAMAMNKPIVSTRIGVGDIMEFIGEDDILLADNPEEFAQHIIKLLSQERCAANVGQNGREIVKQNYSWETAGDKIDKLIRSII